jgi:hypothetical protein
MAKKKTAKASASRAKSVAPQICKATLADHGDVFKGASITEAQAVAERAAGRDVVVCGDDLNVNRALAQKIEHTANGRYKRCPPHASAGPSALPHFQPDPRPPDGHTFYETTNRKAR